MCPTSAQGENLELCVETHMTMVICTIYVPWSSQGQQDYPTGQSRTKEATMCPPGGAGTWDSLSGRWERTASVQAGEPSVKESGWSETDLNYNPSPATCYL